MAVTEVFFLASFPLKPKHCGCRSSLLASSLPFPPTSSLPLSKQKLVLRKANRNGVTTSERTTILARLPTMMVAGDAHQTSLTRSEAVQVPTQSSQLPTERTSHAILPSVSATPTQSSVTGVSSNRPRASSYTVQLNPPTATPHPQPAPHIHFPESGPQNQSQQYGAQVYGDHPTPHNPPPPSPRLQPTHGSALSLSGSASTSPSRIKVRDLSHIQSFASEEVLTRSRHPSRHSLRGRLDGRQQYEISAMPVGDIIEMVAGLLTKITTTNDRQHEHIHRHLPPPDGASGLSAQATSVLAFHGKNVPSITIASYLSRIHKYCPTTYEVFLSLLVYFDRMTEMINSGSLSSFHEDQRPKSSASLESTRSTSNGTAATAVNSSRTAPMSSPSNRSESHDRPLTPSSSSSIPSVLSSPDAYDLSHFFVVDSFNIHRLVMAGVTCASKFFSDVFYTNSRYAKVRHSCHFLSSQLTLSRWVAYHWSN